MKAQLTFEVVLPPSAQGLVGHPDWVHEDYELAVFDLWPAIVRARQIAGRLKVRTVERAKPWDCPDRLYAWMTLAFAASYKGQS